MGEDGRVAVPTCGDSRVCLGGAPCSRPSIGARGGLPIEAAVAVVLPRLFAVTCRVQGWARGQAGAVCSQLWEPKDHPQYFLLELQA